MIALSELASTLQLAVRSGSDEPPVDPVIVDVTHDSTNVADGALFCCISGEHSDGHDYADEAVSKGAVALLCGHSLVAEVPQLLSGDVRRDMSRASSVVWGRPSTRLRIVGVTGTNGKTTVVSMVAAITREAGYRTETVGTLTGERTTPESSDLQRRLAGYVDDGVEVVAMEVSSHALVQHRVADVEFDVALFTNLGRDHLDFHATQEAYFAAKAMLFEPGMAERGVVNVDDVHGRLLHDASTIPMVGVSMADATEYRTAVDGTHFRWRGHRIHLPMAGAHNVSNAVLAATACLELGIDESTIAHGLSSLEQVPGRFEVIRPAPSGAAPSGAESAGVGHLADLVAIVDFAHTPDALESVLTAARELAGTDHRVIVVFGCGGDRDRQKRPLMGATAAAHADLAVVTSDNPRSEDPQAIIDEILGGFKSHEGVRGPQSDETDRVDDGIRTEPIVDPDRRSAISVALSAALDGDVVVIAGKGHETGQSFADRTEPFDDRIVVAELLNEGTTR